MSKEIVGENITSLPTPDQDVRRLTAEGLIELTGTYHYTFEKAISVIREFSPSFHSGDSQQWSLVDLRALAIYLAYYRGARKPSLILILPKEFSPETFEEIDRTFLSYLQMAERWQVSSNYTIELTQLVFPLKLIAEQVPRKRIKNNCRSSLAFPPQFCLLMENELGKARKNHVPLIRWIKAHQKEIQERAKSYLPVFPHQFRQWLEENIIEKQESPESRWEPNKDEIKESIIKTAETITKIKARSPDGNELNDDNLHQTNLPAVSNVRLTREEEKNLGRAVSLMLRAKKAQPLPKNQQLYEKTIGVGKEAKKIMVNTNLRFVLFVVHNYFSEWIGKIPRDDLFQEGTTGLIKAVERFDPRRGGRFSSYAFYWIRQAINRAIINSYSGMIRRPAHVYKERKIIWQSVARLEQEQGRTPAIEEISQETGMSISKLLELLTLPTTTSLDSLPSDPESADFLLWEKHPSFPDPSAEERALKTLYQKQIVAAIIGQANLSERELSILQLRFIENRTLEQIGKEFGLSREWVRQIEERILRKLRAVFEANPSLELS